MITIIAYVLAVVTSLMGAPSTNATVVVIPGKPSYAPYEADSFEMANEYERGCVCDDCYWYECYVSALVDFDEMWDEYETKRASNGRLMIRNGNTGSFKFAKKG